MSRKQDAKKARRKKEAKRRKARRERDRQSRAQAEHPHPGRVKEALRRTEAFEKRSRACSPEIDDLKERAGLAVEQGAWHEALFLLQEGLAQLPEGDRSAAASVLHHNLGHVLESFPGLPLAVRLVQAERHYRAALECPARRADPYRFSQTLCSIASMLRQRALLAQDPAPLDEALKLARRAADLVEKWGPLPPFWHFNPVTTVANIQLARYRLTGDENALRAAEKGHTLVLESPMLQALLDDDSTGSTLTVLVAAAKSRAHCLSLMGASPREQAALHQRVAEASVGREASLARLRQAQVLLDDAKNSEAVRVLDNVEVNWLRTDELTSAGGLAERAGLTERARHLFVRGAQEGMEERRQARSDAEADDLALAAQYAGLRSARLSLAAGRHVEAFVGLEAVAAPRFEEALGRRWWLPKDPEEAAAHAAWLAAQGLCMTLTGLAEAIAPIEIIATINPDADASATAALQELAATTLASGEDSDTPEWPWVREQLQSTLTRALGAPSPAAFLRAETERYAATVERAERQLAAASDSYREARHPRGANILDPLALAELLDEHPDWMLLRFDSVSDTALAITVWRGEDGELQSAGAVTDPESIATVATKLLDGSVPTAGELSAIDISEAIPAEGPRRLVVLAGRDAALLPIAALRADPTNTFLDRFDEIVSLPCLSAMRVPTEFYSGREGVGLVTPAGTLRSDLAIAADSAPRRLAPGEANLDAVKTMLRTSEAVAFYTHGVDLRQSLKIEGLPDGFATEVGLQLDGDAVSPAAFGDAVAGLERVELWACRSGVNAPDSFVPAGLAEAHGLDVTFLRGGARSALGTLWSVPELATATIRLVWVKELEAGQSPAAALVRAQRWWRDRFASGGRPSTQTVAEALRREFDINVVTAHADGHLGPDGFPQEQAAAEFGSWAGFRYIGWPKASREVGATPMVRRDAVLAFLEAAMRPPEPGQAVDADGLDRWFDEKIDDERAGFAAARRASDPDRIAECAIEHARLRFVHPRDAHRLQVFHALAGLHQAEVELERLRNTTRIDEVRGRAALLWCELDLERLQAGPPSLNTMHGPGTLRAVRTLGVLPATSWWAAVVRLALGVATSLPDRMRTVLDEKAGQPRSERRFDLHSAVAAALSLERGANDAAERLLCMWTLRGAVELSSRWSDASLLEPALARAGERGDLPGEYVEQHLEARLAVWKISARRELGEPEHRLVASTDGIPFSVAPLERLATVRLRALQDHKRGAFADRGGLEWISHALAGWESDLWGRFESQTARSALNRFSGGAGAPFTAAAGSWMGGLWHSGNHIRGATETLTQLEYFANRRVQFAHRRNRMLGRSALRHGDGVATAGRLLDEAAGLASMVEVTLDDLGYNLVEGVPCAPKVDPFRESCAEVTGRGLIEEAPAPWHLVDILYSGSRTPGETAAWAVSGRLVELRTIAEALGDGFDSRPAGHGALARILGLDRTWNDCAGWVRKPAAGNAFVGAQVLPDGALTLAVAWCGSDGRLDYRGGRYENTGIEIRLAIQSGSAAHLAKEAAVAQGLLPETVDWLEPLQEAMQPALDECLSPAIRAGVSHVFVLAPFELRSLPLAALKVGPQGRLLCEQVKTLAHVPTWEMLRTPDVQEGPVRAVWNPAPTTSGAECAELTARLGNEGGYVVLSGGSEPDGRIRGLVEIGSAVALHPSETAGLAGRMSSLAILGGHSNSPLRGALAGLDAEGFTISVQHFVRSFPYLRSAHVWAAPESMRSPMDIEYDRVDRLPGFAGALIGAGAVGVLQEAYPLPPLPRVLMAEFVELCGMAGKSGPSALRSAQHWYQQEVAPALALKTGKARHLGVERARMMLAHMLGSESPLPPFPVVWFEDPALDGLEPSDPRCFAVVNWYGT